MYSLKQFANMFKYKKKNLFFFFTNPPPPPLPLRLLDQDRGGIEKNFEI